MTYLHTAARILDAHSSIIDRIQPGELACTSCGRIAPRAQFPLGMGREKGRHPSHRYCACGRSIDYSGYIDGDVVAYWARVHADKIAQPA